MKDIAQDLGVSLMTISKALRGHRDISEATRKRVLQRAAELDYRPNWVAKCLVSRRTHIVGLLIPDLMHSFFAEVARGVSRVLDPLMYQLVISSSDENPDAERRQIELLLSRSVDGLIVASAESDGGKGLFPVLEKRHLPYVLVDRKVAGLDAHFVGVKDDEIGCLATTHLFDQGCRSIAHIRGPAITTGTGRLRGYRRALDQLGLDFREEFVVQGSPTDSVGYEAMQRLLRLPNRPDGVFCYNDPVAVGAMRAVLEAGLSIPEDIALIGAGNIHYSDLLRVPLSTVDQSSSAIGEKAAKLLMQCIGSESRIARQQVLLPPKLVVRESTLRKVSSFEAGQRAGGG